MTVARQLIASGHKDRAVLALKKKRLQETTAAKLDAWLLNVETMLADVEISTNQNKVFAALKQGNEAQKQLQKEVALEDVEKLMDDTAEAKEYQEQLAQLLGQSLTGEDDAVVEEELAALLSETGQEIAAEMPSVPPTKIEEEELPSVPAHAPGAVAVALKKEEEEKPSIAATARIPAS